MSTPPQTASPPTEPVNEPRIPQNPESSNQDPQNTEDPQPSQPEQDAPPKRPYDDDDDDDDDYDPAQALRTTRKRVPGKVIDRFWEPLDKKSLSSLDRILNICLTKAMERYEGKKLAAAQRLLTHAWTADNARSFKARLPATKVPPITTLAKVDDPLSLDQVLRRKTFLETYLSAEMKQLAEIQKHYQEQDMVYKSDLKYLEELRKTTAVHKAKMDKETRPLAVEAAPEHISLAAPPKLRKFDPDTDEDTRKLLESLSKHLKSIRNNTQRLALFNDKLEVVYNILDVL